MTVRTIKRRLLSDREADRVVLIWPHAGLKAYNDALADLQVFYRDFLRELAHHEHVLCVVPDERDAEGLAAATGLPDGSFFVAPIDDIWVRDFAPLACEGGFAKTRYDPEYAETAHSRAVERGFLEFFYQCFGGRIAREMSTVELIVEG